MNSASGIWQFIGGIGLFLFAMSQLETALRRFTGNTLRNFLRDRTRNPIQSVFVGAGATAVLQSSSLVGLIVLAFVGASIMSLQNALGVIFGANLGTTFTGWIVTTLGFKLDLANIALPLIGIGSLVLVGFKGKLAEYGRFIAALGFLLAGLTLMKDSVGGLTETYDISRLEDYSAWQFLLFGVVAAAIVQSSSAVMMLTLTALHANIVDLQGAAAVAIGADLGTTSTIMIGAIKGAPGKKRVALAHVIFNVTTDAIAFAFLVPLLGLITLIGISDPLIALVVFHSLFNFIGIVLFLPVLRQFANYLEKKFKTERPQESRYVAETSPEVIDAALPAIRKDTAYIIGRVIIHNLRVFTPRLPIPEGELPIRTQLPLNDNGEFAGSSEALYRANKQLEGEILSFSLQVQERPLDTEQSRQLNHTLAAVRNAVHSAKSLRDVRHNLEDFVQSPHHVLNEFQQHFRNTVAGFYELLFELRTNGDAAPVVRDFAELTEHVYEAHNQLHHRIYSAINDGRIDDGEVSSLLNVNREVLNSNLALTRALQQFLLEESEIEALGEAIPGS